MGCLIMPDAKSLTYQDLQKRAEKNQRVRYPQMEERVWKWLDEQRRKLPKMVVTPNDLPKDNFQRNYKIVEISLESVLGQKESIETLPHGKVSLFTYLDLAKCERTLLVHKDATGEIVTLAEIQGGDLNHASLYNILGVDVSKQTSDGKESSLYYAAVASQLAPQSFVLDGIAVEIPIYGLLFLVHEAVSEAYPQGRIALTLWQEHMATTATGDYGLLRTLGQASVRALSNPNHPISSVKEIFGEDAFLAAVQNGTYDLAPHAQMDPDKLGNQHNVTPVGITVTPEQVAEIEKKNSAVRFFSPEEIAVLITAGVVNAHTIVLVAEHQARVQIA